MQTETRAASGTEQTVIEGEMRTVRTDDGVTIAYRMAGSGPRNLLFLHGWGGAGSGHSWAEVLRHLDLTGMRASIVGMRVHGRSERTRLCLIGERLDRVNV